MWESSLTKEAAADARPGADADALLGVVEGSEPCVPERLGSMGSELHPDEDGTSMGKQEMEEGGEEPPRLVAEGGLAWLQDTMGGGGEVPVEGTDTELRSSRSVTETDSSPGLVNRGEEEKQEVRMQEKDKDKEQPTNRNISLLIC